MIDCTSNHAKVCLAAPIEKTAELFSHANFKDQDFLFGLYIAQPILRGKHLRNRNYCCKKFLKKICLQLFARDVFNKIIR